MLESAAAAHALRDRVVSSAAVHAILTYAVPAATDRFRPTPAQLGMDLAVALSGRHVDKAHAVARRILQAGIEDDGAVPERQQARTLAHLLDLDTDGASHALRRMPAAIDVARLSKHEHAVLSTWCMAADCIVRRVDLDLPGHLAKATQRRGAYVDNMLGRWTKGRMPTCLLPTSGTARRLRSFCGPEHRPCARPGAEGNALFRLAVDRGGLHVTLILECHAVPSDMTAIRDVRGYGMPVANVSINSAALSVMLPPLATRPLATLDLTAPGPTGVRIPRCEVGNLPGWLASVDIEPNIANAIEDAVEEASAQQTDLWIGFA